MGGALGSTNPVTATCLKALKFRASRKQSSRMRTIANFLQPDEAQLLKMRLEARGIPAVLQDENITQLNPWRMWAMGGVRVQVADEDLEAAQIFLEQERSEATDIEPIAAPEGASCLSCGVQMTDTQTRCHACGWTYEVESIPGSGE